MVTLNRLGKIVALVEQLASPGEKILETSLNLGDELEREAPDTPEYRNEKAEALLLLGFSRVRTSFDQAKIMLESALKIREKLVEEHPSEPEYQSNLVDTCVFIAASYSNARVPERLDEIFNLVRPVSQRLSREHPDVAVFVENDALITTIFATARAIRGDYQAAKALAEEAVARNPQSGMIGALRRLLLFRGGGTMPARSNATDGRAPAAGGGIGEEGNGALEPSSRTRSLSACQFPGRNRNRPGPGAAAGPRRVQEVPGRAQERRGGCLAPAFFAERLQLNVLATNQSCRGLTS